MSQLADAIIEAILEQFPEFDHLEDDERTAMVEAVDIVLNDHGIAF